MNYKFIPREKSIILLRIALLERNRLRWNEVKYRELTEIECVIGFTLHIKAFRYATFLSGGCGYMRKTFPVADGPN